MEEKINYSGKREYVRLIIVVAVILCIVGVFILYLSWPLLTGKTIVLATRPVDPFDILRGQYMTINYEISNLPIIQGVQEGDMAYVVLKEDGAGVWRYESESLAKPDSGVFIRGVAKVVNVGTMRMEYGIEQFFFERDAEFLTGNLSVEAKVDSSGQARIVRLLQDGEPIKIKYKIIGAEDA